ncbi:MAG: hypothetical protein CMQ40_09460 [Gammaproteobacteria bacterium]|nr:hypothetical protein [Gammaproteobacteria bacterium]
MPGNSKKGRHGWVNSMGLRTEIKRFLLQNKIFLHGAGVNHTLDTFVSRFREKYRPVELIRVGPQYDGGYLMPDILDDIDYCFSAGVGHTSNFEKDLFSRNGIRSFLLDASVDFPKLEGDFFKFEKKFLGVFDDDKVITLSSWLQANSDPGNNRLLLQMDIEGSEYEILSFVPASSLDNFSCMIIEFHDFHKLFDRNFCFTLNGIFEKIYQNFSIVHAHPSSYRKLIEIDGYAVPPTIEITFLRNDILENLEPEKNFDLPHRLDNPNSPKHSDIKLPDAWWKN